MYILYTGWNTNNFIWFETTAKTLEELNKHPDALQTTELYVTLQETPDLMHFKLKKKMYKRLFRQAHLEDLLVWNLNIC